eukprot:g5483.t1
MLRKLSFANSVKPSGRLAKPTPRGVRVRVQDLKKILEKGAFAPDPAYVEGGEFLKSLGMTNQAEISRVLDVAMNPDSLFLSPKERRISNASARRLSVKNDMKPVLLYLRSVGLMDTQIVKMVSSNPSILGYSVENRLAPVYEFLESVGVKDPSSALANRPSLFGLDVENNLKKMVDYLQDNEYAPEQIVKWLETSL